MTSMDDLRGSTPTHTAKDVLVDVQRDVKKMREDLAVLRSQDLNGRVAQLEAFKWKVVGTSAAGAIIAVAILARDLFVLA